MTTCLVDTSIQRLALERFSFPLGVYPIEDMTPVPGYSVDFEPADGDDEEGEWEEWPDRYVYDVVISAERLESLCRSLFSMLSPRVYPILDLLGQDAYREIDPYIAYELVGLDRFTDGVRRFRGFLYEDGLVGFGAMSEEPFLYIFVDEHKIVTVRAETSLKEKVEKVLAAFDLPPVPLPAGADAAAHEHRSVLVTPPARPDVLTPEEIADRLREDWRLTLNIDPDTNVDDDGHDLGVTCWRILVLCAASEEDPGRYAEVLLTAGSLREAEELALEGSDALVEPKPGAWVEQSIVSADRVTPDEFAELMGDPKAAADPNETGEERIFLARWLE